jgi:hypothetical protein
MVKMEEMALLLFVPKQLQIFLKEIIWAGRSQHVLHVASAITLETVFAISNRPEIEEARKFIGVVESWKISLT